MMNLATFGPFAFLMGFSHSANFLTNFNLIPLGHFFDFAKWSLGHLKDKFDHFFHFAGYSLRQLLHLAILKTNFIIFALG